LSAEGRFGQPVLDAIRLADHVEAHRPGVDGVPVPGLLCELDTPRPFLSDQCGSNGSTGQNRVDLLGHGFEHVLKEFHGRLSVRSCNELGVGELGSAVNTDEEKELALPRLHFGDVDVKEPDGVSLELLPLGFVSRDIRKARNAMTLQATMQRRPGQPRDRWLKSIEAFTQWQQCVPPEREDHRLLGLGQNR
jgi:hypothetical protein